MIDASAVRLYRGLKTAYRREGVVGRLDGTDFTDCPYTALQYATGPRGEVLVLEVEPGANVRISEQLWFDRHAKRLMVWGCFDDLLAGIFPAKELRAEVRNKGIRASSREYKVQVLERFIDRSLRARTGTPEGGDRSIWRRYVQVQAGLLSDSVRSFNSIHDRAKRCETGHIRDGTWMSDVVARRHGLEIDADGFAGDLWEASHQSFSLARHVAEYKFGPHYVVCKTPLDNIRLTTFFARENEVRVISPQRLSLVEAHGCRVEYRGAVRESSQQ